MGCRSTYSHAIGGLQGEDFRIVIAAHKLPRDHKPRDRLSGAQHSRRCCAGVIGQFELRAWQTDSWRGVLRIYLPAFRRLEMGRAPAGHTNWPMVSPK